MDNSREKGFDAERVRGNCCESMMQEGTTRSIDIVEEASKRGYKVPYSINVIKELTGLKSSQIKIEIHRLNLHVERGENNTRLFDEHGLRCLYEVSLLKSAGVKKIESIKEFLKEKGLEVEEQSSEPLEMGETGEGQLVDCEIIDGEYIDIEHCEAVKPEYEIAACVEADMDIHDIRLETVSNDVANKIAIILGKDMRDIKEFIHSIQEQNAANSANVDFIRAHTNEILASVNTVKNLSEKTNKKIEVLKNNSVEVAERLEQLNLNTEKSEWNLGKIQGYIEKSSDTVIVNGERLVEINGKISNVEERIAAMKEEMEKRKEEGEVKRHKGFLNKAKSLLNILGLSSSPQEN